VTRLCRPIRPILTLLAVLAAGSAAAADSEIQRAYLEVSPANRAELELLLDTLERSLASRGAEAVGDPVVIVLHGDEALGFTRDSYLENRQLVDRAALLDAYRLIDVRMCETWMNENGVTRADLLPFIETVPYAPEEIRRLEEAGYKPLEAVNL